MRYLRRARSRSSLVAAAVVVAGLAGGVGGVAWAGKGGDAKGPPVRKALTLTFSADGVRRDLFKIGGSRVWARCVKAEEGVDAGLMGRNLRVEAGDKGAVLATEDGHEVVAPNGNSAMFIGPGLIEPRDGVQAEHLSFAIFDGSGPSASGTLALMTDAPNKRCTATIQVAG